MSNVAEKITDFSIWDSVVNDRIVQFENLEEKYKRRGHQIDDLIVENEKLKEKMASIITEYNTAKNEKENDKIQIEKLICEIKELRQTISNMENSTCWKLTMPLRRISDKWRMRW